MTVPITELPYKELDRHHKQAIIGLRDAVRHGCDETYVRMAAEERRARNEKIRRQQLRARVDAEVRE